MPSADYVLVIDFGGQYTQLIARKIRELEVFSEIVPFNKALEKIAAQRPAGIVLSGGPSSIYQQDAPRLPDEVFKLGIPMLGICYGMHLMARYLGGTIAASDNREYGKTLLYVEPSTELLAGVPNNTVVWMSHRDKVTNLPDTCRPTAHTDGCPVAAFSRQHLHAVQFHPEVSHTQAGRQVLHNFLHRVCRIRAEYTAGNFIREQVAALRRQVGGHGVVLGLSGGVDSSVTAALLHRAIGDRLYPIFVDNGLLRYQESERIRRYFTTTLGMRVIFADAGKQFLDRLQGVTDPIKKRRIIGETFIRVFEKQAEDLRDIRFLAQGTLYPDVIESVSVKGPSSMIKPHHNVGGLPEQMDLELIEPLRYLFKDEVRRIGRELGLPEQVIGRHPFPGPGLAVRILGAVTPEKVALLQQADHIMLQEVRKAGYYDRLWQAFAVLLPVKTIGVMGDEGTYEQVIALRAVESEDAMTVDWAKLPHSLLETISSRITSEVQGVNRVVYDITSKPPGTIEWE